MNTLSIKILSPAFYSRFIHYSFAKEAFDREFLCTDEKNRTGLVVQNQALSVLLKSAERLSRATATSNRKSGLFTEAHWRLLQHLRCPAALPSYPDASPPAGQYITQDIRAFPLSELDRFARYDCQGSSTYRHVVVKLFIAQRYFFGLGAVVTLVDVSIRIAFIASSLYCLEAASVPATTGWAKEVEHHVAVRMLIAGSVGSVVHLWSLLKG